MLLTRLSAIWSAPAKRRRKTSCGIATGRFLLRHGQRPTSAGEPWTKKYLNWIRIHARFEEPALEATLAHYLGEVEHASERIAKLEQAIDEAVKQAPAEIRAVIEALQALRGVAQTTAATVVCELGSLSRFESPRQLMGYSGLVPREYSSGNRSQRGAITKSGNAHLRRVLVESGMGVPASAQCAGPGVEKTESAGAQRRGQGDCLEGTATAAQEVCRADSSRKNQRSGHDSASP